MVNPSDLSDTSQEQETESPIRTAIMDVLRPTLTLHELLLKLHNEHPVLSHADIKAKIQQLISDGKIQLTVGRKLKALLP